MENFLDMIFDPLNAFMRGFISFVPNLLAMLLIFVIGLFFAWLIKTSILKVLKVINFDRWCDRVGLTAIIRKGDVWAKPSDAFVYVLYWILILLFLMIGLSALQLQAVNNLITQIFLYIPRIFSALLILIIGYIVAGFISRAVLVTAVNSGYHYAKLLAEAVRLLLIVMILAMAMEQLQIAPGIVIAAFSLIFGGIVLSLAIAFGVGGIDAAKKIVEGDVEENKTEEKEKEGREIEHL